MVTQTYTTTIKGSLGTISPSPVVVSADAEEAIGNVVDANDTLIETLAIDASEIEAFYIWSDKDITVTTNPGASQTFNIEANKPFWWSGDGTCPITVDITEIHFDNTANAEPANVKAEFLLSVAT